MQNIPRRSFLLGAAAAAGALGSNDRIDLAVVGLSSRGADHIDAYLQQPSCRLHGVCDIDSAARERAETRIYNKAGYKPKTYRDMRDVFADKEVVGSSWPRKIAGMLWLQFGPVARRRRFIAKSLLAITSGKAGKWSKPLENTTVWSRSARKAGACPQNGSNRRS